METTQRIGEGLTFEKVWAALMENRDQIKETDRQMKETDLFLKEKFAETDRQIKKTDRQMKETDRQMKATERFLKERFAETDRIIKDLGKNVGGLNRSLGELIETLIAARLWEKFPQYGFVRAYRRLPIHDETNRLRTDIDILLFNSDKVMAVEVKHELNKDRDVEEHLKRMELIRSYPPFMELGTKQLLGAMAGGVVNADTARYAYEAGFYVLELTGETVSLIPPPAGFEPGAW
jgi:hypothetical protein